MVDRINLVMHSRRYLKMIGGRWWLLVLCSLIGLGINAYRAFTRPNLYQSYSILSIPSKVATQSIKAPVLEIADKFYETRLEEMRHPIVLKRAQEEVNRIIPAPKRRAVTPVAQQGPGASFRLVVTSTDFDTANAFSTNWTKEILVFKEEKRRSLYDRTALDERESLLREQLKLSNIVRELQQFRIQHKVGNTKEADINAQRQLSRLRDEYDEIKKQRQLLEQTTATRIAEGGLSNYAPTPRVGSESPNTNGDNQDKTLAGSDPFEKFSGGSRYKELSLQLREKQVDWDKHKDLLKPKHPYMLQLQTAISSAEQSIRFELELIEGSRQAQLETLRRREEDYLPLIEKQLKLAQESSTIQDQYQRLLDDEEIQKIAVQTLDKNLRSIDRGTASDGDDVYEIPAAGIGDPNAPIWGNENRKKMILMGFLSGLAAGIAIAYLLQRLDDRLELAEDIEEALSEPVLGQIPKVDAVSNKDGFLLITKLSQHNMFSESIRGVRSAIMLGTEGGLKQLLLVSSAVPGDGKTTFTVNFAATLAIAGHRVLLVDADLRRGNVHFYFRSEREDGLTEVLTGKIHWKDVLKQTEIKSLDIISTGDLPPNPGELLISPITKEFLAEARADYDYIIVDCPPLTAIDDTFSLANIADGLLFVVRAGQTSMKFAKNALQAVRHRGAKIYGVVLNCITADNPYYYYSNYYHAYYNKDSTNDKPLGDAPRPGSRMAQRKIPSRSGSIDAAAKAHVGEYASRSALAASEAAKAQEFKARRAAAKRKSEDGEKENSDSAEIDPLSASSEPQSNPVEHKES